MKKTSTKLNKPLINEGEVFTVKMKGEVILEADIILWFQFKFCLRLETDNT